MKKYKELTWVEAAQALEDGLTVQFNADNEFQWSNKVTKSVTASAKYRLVTETKKPKKGDVIRVWDKYKYNGVKRKFACFYEHKVVTMNDRLAAYSWNHWCWPEDMENE
jgi:hypothetical protein